MLVNKDDDVIILWKEWDGGAPEYLRVLNVYPQFPKLCGGTRSLQSRQRHVAGSLAIKIRFPFGCIRTAKKLESGFMMPCAECERLRWQQALALQAIQGLVEHRADPDPTWQLELLLELNYRDFSSACKTGEKQATFTDNERLGSLLTGRNSAGVGCFA